MALAETVSHAIAAAFACVGFVATANARADAESHALRVLTRQPADVAGEQLLAHVKVNLDASFRWHDDACELSDTRPDLRAYAGGSSSRRKLEKLFNSRRLVIHLDFLVSVLRDGKNSVSSNLSAHPPQKSPPT